MRLFGCVVTNDHAAMRNVGVNGPVFRKLRRYANTPAVPRCISAPAVNIAWLD